MQVTHGNRHMLQFRVHDPHGPDGSTPEWTVRSGHLVDAEGRTMRGSVRRDGGSVVCTLEGGRHAALGLLAKVGGAGGAGGGSEDRLVVQTCLLPERDEPYELFVEVARWVIKQWLERCEKWQMWRPALSSDSGAIWEDARGRFRAALRADDPREAERLAREAVQMGLEACELLARRHAEFLLAQRFRRKAASPATLGVCIDPALAPTPAACAAAKQFDILVIRTPWREIELSEGKRDFSRVDALVQWAASQQKFVVLGPLVDFSLRDGRPAALPNHAVSALRDAKRFRDLVYAQASSVVARYPRVGLVIAASGANLPGWAPVGLEQMFDWLRTAVVATRSAKPAPKVVVELLSPSGEEWGGASGAAWPVAFLQRMVSESLPVAATGLRVVEGAHGDSVRDLLSTASMIDGYGGHEMKLLLSSFGVPSSGDGAARGARRGGPSESTQAAWARAMLEIGLGRPSIEGAWWSRLQDAPGGPTDGVLDASGRPKPVLRAIMDLRQRISAPLGGVEEEVA